MKRLLIMVTLAAGLAACNSNANSNAGALQTTQRYKDSLKLDSFKRAEAVSAEIDRREEEARLAESEKTAAVARSASKQTVVHHTYAATPATTAKKGWSSAAKGAAIGAGAGAVTGILVDKKDGRGAVIGGVVGAGTGYVIGRSKDKKTGRAQ
ncbi:hypothetical protein GZH53_14045 [Flavihumibacter sp. R14]|nr:hypothetical protein [Flavihumibacter soli]